MQGRSSSILDGSRRVAEVLLHHSQQSRLVSSAQWDVAEGDALQQSTLSNLFLCIQFPDIAVTIPVTLFDLLQDSGCSPWRVSCTCAGQTC